MYNGWRNYETWNISLWINNDEGLYRLAVDFMSKYEGLQPYKDFIGGYDLETTETPDRVDFSSTLLNYRELNEMMEELS